MLESGKLTFEKDPLKIHGNVKSFRLAEGLLQSAAAQHLYEVFLL